MSQQPISRSQDLRRLRNEGFDLEIRSGYLLVKDVPYVNSKKEIKLGTLVSELTLAAEVTVPPRTHVAYFVGEHPCDCDGAKLAKIAHSSSPQNLDEGLVADHSFSAKPMSGHYGDYYEKVTTYVAIISGPAGAIDPHTTARTFPIITTEEAESVFNYTDTATSRAGINSATKKLELDKIAIVGVGGTGSYVLDLVAKTPAVEIHLFDKDIFLQHNAFRSPGAPSLEDLGSRPKKVAYYGDIYSRMRRGIVAHDYSIDASNAGELQEMSFVFLCIDAGGVKEEIVGRLEEFGISFIDVGMDVELVDSSLRGALRVTTSTPQKRDHFRGRVSFVDAGGDNDYDRNIQVADLNALNAALAVIKWKKLCGFYHDLGREHNCVYTTIVNMLTDDETE